MTSPESRAKAGAGQFQPGKSGNPGGFSKARRAARERIRTALDTAFTREDGSDMLVDAIVAGVRDADSTCIRLACEYRWGKPETDVNLHDGNGDPLSVAQVRDAVDEALNDPEKRRELRAAVRGEN